MFQSTRPVWGATYAQGKKTAQLVGFNPRAPCGARLLQLAHRVFLMWFQSTRPVWGATRAEIRKRRLHHVSIHAPRVGRDQAA